MTEEAAAMRDERVGRSLSEAVVTEIMRRILTVLRPTRVVLFGSAATGTMTRDSDIDLLVVADSVSDARADAVRVRRALRGLPFAFDVIVMSRERFEETRGVIGGIAWPAARHGRVIYEAA
jgi:predicted nucleotidyltransferase